MSTPTSGSSLTPGASTPPVPGRKVAGWLIICGAIVPLAMAARGEGWTPVWIGGATLAVGSALALIPSRRDRKN